MVDAIHVFHTRAATHLAELVRKAAPNRAVVELSTEAALAAARPEIEVLFAPRPPRSGWQPASRLRLIQLGGVGADLLLPSPDLPPGVAVATLRGLYADDVAEHIVMTALVLARRLVPMLEEAGQRLFRSRPVPRLRGRRWVFLGAGAIGRAAASRLSAMGVVCDAVSRRGRPDPAFRRCASAEALADVVQGADGLVVCVPLTPETRGVVSDRILAALPEGASLIDVSRGGVVDETALLRALHQGRLTVARDVFEEEPLPAESPFFDAPGCLITPHIAGYAEGYLHGAVTVLLENVGRLEAGQPLTRLADRVSNY